MTATSTMLVACAWCPPVTRCAPGVVISHTICLECSLRFARDRAALAAEIRAAADRHPEACPESKMLMAAAVEGLNGGPR